jgi:hypothetical protein
MREKDKIKEDVLIRLSDHTLVKWKNTTVVKKTNNKYDAIV